MNTLNHKETFVAAEIETVAFDAEDVIRTSIGGFNGGEVPLTGDPTVDALGGQ